MTGILSLAPESVQICGWSHHRAYALGSRSAACAPLKGDRRRVRHIFVRRRHRRPSCDALHVSAVSVTERYEQAEKTDPIRPLRHPLAAWQRWWYIGATPQAELPQSQKLSKICARLWGIMKHSKTSLSFAVTFMVSCSLHCQVHVALSCIALSRLNCGTHLDRKLVCNSVTLTRIVFGRCMQKCFLNAWCEGNTCCTGTCSSFRVGYTPLCLSIHLCHHQSQFQSPVQEECAAAGDHGFQLRHLRRTQRLLLQFAQY